MPINSKTYGKLSRAFTLIELLAVIVIIAVIALITVPLIINVIEKSQKNAFVDSAYGIIEAGKLYYMENTLEKDSIDRYDFKVEEKKFILENDSTKELKFTGKMPERGTLQLHKNGEIAIAICNGTYCACKSVKEINVTLKENNCNINSETGEIEDEKAKDGTPAGTVISYMGKNPPEGYLACDGQTYNINEYKFLAEQIKANFGSYNYFGGNGTTTFAVPDLQGEFLRGTGINSHVNQGSGETVGVHQNATEHLYYRSDTTNMYIVNHGSRFDCENEDYLASKGGILKAPSGAISIGGSTWPIYYTSRPTNTSVLYCIKY